MRAAFILILLLLANGNIYAQEKSLSQPTPLYRKIADYEINKGIKAAWNYETGIFLKSLYPEYFNYVQRVMSSFVNDDGTIRTYSMDDYNLDQINQGKLLLDLYAKTKEEKYKKAAFLLERQLNQQPRTADGGFWHKKIYPHQIWLDGIYMAAPFYAQFAAAFNQPQGFDIAANQILCAARHMRDPKTGLFYHGWDESKKEKWANPVTGSSSQLWGRGVGWYLMGIIDTLDYLPAGHPQRKEIIALFQTLARDTIAVQDKETGLWYQVLDQTKRKGNYLEASASAMFAYAIAKGVKQGFLDKKYLSAAVKAYNGIIKNLIKIDPDGSIHLTHICKSAGLGGTPYRDGSYAYYINEPQATDDLKGLGAFILAGREIKDAN